MHKLSLLSFAAVATGCTGGTGLLGTKASGTDGVALPPIGKPAAHLDYTDNGSVSLGDGYTMTFVPNGATLTATLSLNGVAQGSVAQEYNASAQTMTVSGTGFPIATTFDLTAPTQSYGGIGGTVASGTIGGSVNGTAVAGSSVLTTSGSTTTSNAVYNGNSASGSINLGTGKSCNPVCPLVGIQADARTMSIGSSPLGATLAFIGFLIAAVLMIAAILTAPAWIIVLSIVAFIIAGIEWVWGL